MITKNLWEEFKEKNLVENPVWSNDYDPDDLAFDLTTRIVITPFCIVFDFILLPLEILCFIAKRHYEKKLKKGE